MLGNCATGCHLLRAHWPGSRAHPALVPDPTRGARVRLGSRIKLSPRVGLGWLLMHPIGTKYGYSLLVIPYWLFPCYSFVWLEESPEALPSLAGHRPCKASGGG